MPAKDFTFVDIPEGASLVEMPANGFGRVKTSDWINEVYFKCGLGKEILFVAIGQSEHHRYMRWWFIDKRFSKHGGIMYFPMDRWSRGKVHGR